MTAVADTVLDPATSERTPRQVRALTPGVRLLADLAASEHAEAEVNFVELQVALAAPTVQARAQARQIVLGHLRQVCYLARLFDVAYHTTRELLVEAQQPRPAPDAATVTSLDARRPDRPAAPDQP